MQNNFKVAGIIQARMGSSRFPGKTLAKIKGLSCLNFLFERIKKSELDNIIVVTSDQPIDRQIIDLCDDIGINHFTGSEQNVFSRISQALHKIDCDYFLRITGDDILLDSEVINYFIEQINLHSPDFISSFESKTYPNGLVMSGFKKNIFISAYRNSLSSYYKEHVIPFFIDNKVLFNYLSLHAPKDFLGFGINLAIDHPVDLTKVDLVFGNDLLNQSAKSIISKIISNSHLREMFADGAVY